MKPTLPLALLGAILFAGCDTGTQASTSSETQTALQELADNADAIVSNTPSLLSTPSLSVSARGMSTRLDTLICAGYPWQSSYQWREDSFQVDRFVADRESLGQGVGPDGTPSTCSAAESHHTLKTFHLDSVVRLQSEGNFSQVGNEFRQSFEGSGTLDFRTGASFKVTHFSHRRTATLDTIAETLAFKENCSVEFTYATGSSPRSGVDAPVVCCGKTVGRFSWDLVSTPKVTDLSGSRIPPGHRPPISFPEDSLGLHATIIDVGLDSGDTSAHLRTKFVLNLLPGDTAMDTVYMQSPAVMKVARLGSADDTISFHFTQADLKQIRMEDTLLVDPPRPFFAVNLRNGPSALSRTFVLPRF